jgi:hypothetical protein
VSVARVDIITRPVRYINSKAFLSPCCDEATQVEQMNASENERTRDKKPRHPGFPCGPPPWY